MYQVYAGPIVDQGLIASLFDLVTKSSVEGPTPWCSFHGEFAGRPLIELLQGAAAGRSPALTFKAVTEETVLCNIAFRFLKNMLTAKNVPCSVIWHVMDNPPEMGVF